MDLLDLHGHLVGGQVYFLDEWGRGGEELTSPRRRQRRKDTLCVRERARAGERERERRRRVREECLLTINERMLVWGHRDLLGTTPPGGLDGVKVPVLSRTLFFLKLLSAVMAAHIID